MNIRVNFIFNILGSVLPMLVAIPLMGYLARELGRESFALLLIFFSIVGYSSLLDAGVARALVLFISKEREIEKIKVFFSSAISFVFFISLFICCAIIFFKNDILLLMQINSLEDKTFGDSLLWVSYSIPFYVMSAICYAFYEGVQNFKRLNLIKIALNPLISIMPVIFVYFFQGLESASIGLFFARIIIFFMVFFGIKENFSVNRISFEAILSMLRYSGWITISNTIGPLMSNFDRFLVSHLYGISNSAYYIAAADFCQRASLITLSVDKVVFPFISNNNGGKGSWVSAMKLSMTCSFLVIFPLMIAAPFLLEYWLGEEFSRDLGTSVRILMFALLLNSFCTLPYSYIQAVGDSKFTAKLHLIEFFPFLFLLFFLGGRYGVEGVAWGCVLRALFEMIALNLYARSIRRERE